MKNISRPNTDIFILQMNTKKSSKLYNILYNIYVRYLLWKLIQFYVNGHTKLCQKGIEQIKWTVK